MNYLIDCNSYKSTTYDKRVRFLILHYTAENFASSIESLTNKLSAHYLIPDPTDPTYKHNQLNIFNLVPEHERAWHAGVSAWEDRTNLNDSSIGIEIVNMAPGDQSTNLDFPDYNEQQIQATIELCNNIITRHPEITPTRIIGHCDIAPGRKNDPGPKFPWHKLYKHGIGAWYDVKTKEKYLAKYSKNLPKISQIQSQLKNYGYAINITDNYDKQTKDCIRAFQIHFRPEKYDGIIDIETIAILSALIEKYKK